LIRITILAILLVFSTNTFGDDLSATPDLSDDPIGQLIYSRTTGLATEIAERFRIPQDRAEKIVDMADQNAYEDFPTSRDILSVIAVESGFNPKARSGSSGGLMQVNIKSHPELFQHWRDMFSIDKNIEAGAAILRDNYEALGHNRKKALLAYNSGIGGVMTGNYHLAYFRKWLKERAWFTKRLGE
jgi:hypothetical protein